ncbi:MAG: transcriptional repressor LexA [Clostridia bacterium]|nr:transcriptional repressor LexA [Clostridia bacterium]
MTTNITELRPKQREIFEFIRSYVNSHRIPPTVREIAIAVNLRSTSTVHMHLKELKRKGFIYMENNKQRTIVIADNVVDEHNRNIKAASDPLSDAQKHSVMPVPLLGDVAAGNPIMALDAVNEVLILPNSLLHGASKDEVFLLSVKGDSMIDIGMYDGDMILVNTGLSYNDGDIVVARVEGETATVKRIYRQQSCVRLQPENSTMDPIIVDYSAVEVVGKVISLIRKY